MSRIIIVSNRVATASSAAAGGLAVALSDVLARESGVWLGWSGCVGDANDAEFVEGNNCARATLALTEEEHRGYYLGYANSVLWPVFHNRVDLAEFEAGFYPVFSAVNRRFAEALLPFLRPGDVVWVHDYHLIELGRALRALGVDTPIGFFLHIPFPPWQSFLAVPEHLQLADAFAAYDLVGLQTTADVANFLEYVKRGPAGHLLPDGRLRIGTRSFSVGSYPIGIEPGDIAQLGATAPPRDPEAQKTVIGVDRLDYTKGLPGKFRAFDRFLQRHPEWHRLVELTQIAAPTRESVEAYVDIRKELESLSGAINGRYGDLSWTPVRYINRTIPRQDLAPIYRAASVGLVTPLRDGMNLVAKEYVAAQDAADPGVLVLSQFAGAAEEMSEALLVNPYNPDEIADAIAAALVMPLAERQRRHAALLARIEAMPIGAWADLFLGHLRARRQIAAYEIPDTRSLAERGRKARASPPATDAGLLGGFVTALKGARIRKVAQ